MRELMGKLQAARIEDVAPDDLPVIPEWWPLDRPATEDSEAIVYTDEQRALVRRTKAMTDARRGPFDGQTIGVLVPPDPPDRVTFCGGGYVYELSATESDAHSLVYRYSPHASRSHRAAMEQITEGFQEYGREHVLAAQHQAAEHDGIDVERITP